MQLRRTALFRSLPLICLVACGGSGASTRPPPPVSDDTTLGVGDVFEVRVYGEEALSGTYRVDNNGTVNYPFVGSVELAGLEPTAAAQLLARRLQEGEYLREPQVSILVQEYNSKRVSVVGSVASPGTFPMTAGLTVVQAISLAGGFTSIASRDNTVLSRTVDGRLVRYRVAVDDVTEGRAEDVPLQAGDMVYVPERLF